MKVTAEIKENRLLLPSEALESLGWRDTARIMIEIKDTLAELRQAELSVEEIADLASIYLTKYVGDAVEIRSPLLKADKWYTEVVLSYSHQAIGHLNFSRDGKLLDSESSSVAELKGIVA